MAKMTLLDLTQEVLRSIGGDQVNSYAETVESEDVAYTIRNAYLNLITNLDIPEKNGTIVLTALGDVDQPTHMKIPDTVDTVKSVKYNTIKSGGTRISYETVNYKEPEDFLDIVLSRNSTDSNIQTVQITGAKLFIQNDKRPEHFTSFDDEFLIFDSFDSGVDSTLQQSKFLVRGVSEPVFTMSDTFVPDIDANLFPLLINEAKSLAAVEIEQSSNPKAEQYAGRQWTRWQNDRSKLDNSMKGPDYGRRNRSGNNRSTIVRNS